MSMARQFFAKLDDDNKVIDVKVVDRAYLESRPDRYPGRWVEAFPYDPSKVYPAIGAIYNEETKEFEHPTEIQEFLAAPLAPNGGGDRDETQVWPTLPGGAE